MDAVFDTQKRLAGSFPIRETDVAIVEDAKAQGVTSVIVIPSTVYGKGTGQWNQLSVVIPVYISASISRKAVYKFPENTKVSGVHISDLTALYALITQKILAKEPIPSNEEGYYFALAHDLHWWEVLDYLAAALKVRKLIPSSEIPIWENDDTAAKALGVPVEFLQVLWNSGERITATKPRSIGWQPQWDNQRFLQNIDAEIDAVVELGQAKSSLMESLFKA